MAWHLESCNSRTEVGQFSSTKDWEALIDEAFKMERYYICFKTYPYGHLVEKGINPATGPDEFDIKEFISKQKYKIDVDMYETTLIYNFLVEINNMLKELEISTIQSEPSYYNFDVTFSDPCYIQNPYIELVGELSSSTIVFFKLLAKHPLLTNYMITLYQSSSYNSKYITDDTKKLRLSIIKKYVDEDGDIIAEFDDTDFWKDVIKSIEHSKYLMSTSKCNEFDITKNDPELDITKDWFIYDKLGYITEIIYKEDCLNPYNGFPLTTLEVRYEPKEHLFLQQHILEEPTIKIKTLTI